MDKHLEAINTADPHYNKDYVKRKLVQLTDPKLIERMTAGEKRAATLKARDPNYYSKMAKKRRKPFLHFSWLKQSEPDRLKRISKAGGKSRKHEVYPPSTFNH